MKKILIVLGVMLSFNAAAQWTTALEADTNYDYSRWAFSGHPVVLDNQWANHDPERNKPVLVISQKKNGCIELDLRGLISCDGQEISLPQYSKDSASFFLTLFVKGVEKEYGFGVSQTPGRNSFNIVDDMNNIDMEDKIMNEEELLRQMSWLVNANSAAQFIKDFVACSKLTIKIYGPCGNIGKYEYNMAGSKTALSFVMSKE